MSVDRKIVRHGGLTVEVPDLAKAIDAVRAAVSAAGGFVTSETLGRDEYDVRQGTLTCRVPAERLDATVAAFQGMGRLISMSIQAEDITEQYLRPGRAPSQSAPARNASGVARRPPG